MTPRIIPTNNVPPGGWTYTEPFTKFLVEGRTLAELKVNLRAHREANGIGFGEDWERELEKELCQEERMMRFCRWE